MTEHIYDDSIECAFVNDTKRERIVRCRDCKYYETIPEDSGDWCGYWTDRIYADTRGSGFCAWGEIRDDE